MDRTMTLAAERGERGGFSLDALVRQSGLLAMAAGFSIFLTPLMHPADPRSAVWVPVHLLYFATLVTILLVLVGIFVRQLPQAGRLNLAGFITAFVGTSMMLLEGREHLFSPDFGQGTPLGLAWSGYALWTGTEHEQPPGA